MLVPALVRANYKVTTSLTVTLEDLLGVNLPLLYPEVLVINRTPTSCVATVSGQRRFVFVNSTDSDFDGTVTGPYFSTISLTNGLVQALSGLPGASGLLPTSPYGQAHDLTFANAGPAAELWISLMLKGLVETAVSPDPFIVTNV